MRKSALVVFGLVVAAIVALGLIVLSSAGEANAVRIHGDPYHFIKSQSIFLGFGIVLAIFAALIDYHYWRTVKALPWIVFGFVFILLLLVFPPFGREINGSYRWINLGFANVQPSEFAKITTILVLAAWLDRVGTQVESFFKGAFCPGLIVGAMALPVMLEPDFGSTLVIGLVAAVLMILAGVKMKHLALLGLVGGIPFAYRVITNANRMARIASFLGVKLNIGAEVADAATERAAYQVNQALVAIGNGGIWGVGLNQSMQKHYYLPEAHTDFIFAIGAEELGLVFSVGVILLFVLFFVLSIYIARHAADRFGRYLVMGLSFIIFFQAMFNIGVVCKALPTKGMALPFFSYGGTNLMSAFFAVGTILSVGLHSVSHRKRHIRNG